jgi:hypothetical protein
MADGHLNKCIECTKSDAKQHREKNIDRIREYDRERSKTSSRIRHAIEVSKRWRAEDSRRVKAHSAVARAIRSGQVQRMPCEACNRPDTHAHHDDYDQPLQVRWLCPACHAQHHKENT